ncbi:PIN domain-containing protein [Aquiflexum sp. LQ15W]|uniref:type II toxin-antitoxin system VapC family toxin n=1 Tax=Cognataquiflexum nitidum TaxID=2922272 RepID=UPI001F149367|nr:PIN domain-containing protein [Cognataquiflexum nitidum]MCH6199295.1 PIN domain-containing protein [Cognataquiflexum nitidum]
MKDKVFLDTKVVVDLLGEREPYYDAAAKIATLADKGKIEIFVSASTYSTVYHLLSRFENKTQVKEKIRKFKLIAQTCDLTDNIIDKGLSSNFNDFEDALQYYCALKMDCKIMITRNGKDFKESEIPVLSPDEYLKIL